MSIDQISDYPASLLEYVPANLQSQVVRHWRQGWENSERFIPGVPLPLLGKIWACSDFIAGLCTRKPHMWQALVESGDLFRRYHPEDFSKKLASITGEKFNDDTALMRALRALRQREMLRIAWRDLSGEANTAETLKDLTDLADTCVEAALQSLYEELSQTIGVPCNEEGQAQKLVVLGMGKLGGGELNFSSDIDLMFFFPEDGETRGRRSMANSQFFIRLGQRLIKVLDQVTGDGFVFRVDMRLRPWGDSGPLVMSFAAAEDYYQSQGRDWERYAMIKARTIAGDIQAGEQLLASLKPFVYRRYLDFGAFAAIREMKAMIEAEIHRKGYQRNIKLGQGGIREIEFIGQTFQLIRGGSEPELQARGILDVLRLLAEKGYLPERTVSELTESYDVLRRVENRLQMFAEQQTHILPKDEEGCLRLALAMGYQDWPSLEKMVNRHRQRVQGHFEQVFAAPQYTEAGATEGHDEEPLRKLWATQLPDETAVRLLQQAGFTAPEDIQQRLQAFRRIPAVNMLSGTGRQRLDALMPLLLGILAGHPSAVEVLDRVLVLLSAVVRRSVYLALLVEYPVALSQLVKLCAASPWIAHLLARHPILLDELLDPRSLYRKTEKEELEKELEITLARVENMGLEEQMEVLRKFRQAQVLRVAATDVAGVLPLFDVSSQLTQVAEVILAQVYRLAWEQMTARHGRPQCRDTEGTVHHPVLAIVAYGKLGGIELGYGSDLDIVLLHDSQGEDQYTDGERSLDNSTFFARLAQRIIHILSTQMAAGRLYETDMRLRPEGNAGLPVSSLEAFDHYQHHKAWTWEHQALIRARVVQGSQHLVHEFDRIRQSVLTRRREPHQLRQDVVEMREKMRSNLGSRKPGVFDLKQDAGGIVDIEFLVQYGVLLTAGEHPELLKYTSTIELLDVLSDCDWLCREDAALLLEAYRVFREHIHKQALQERRAEVEAADFDTLRDGVKRIWCQVMEAS